LGHFNKINQGKEFIMKRGILVLALAFVLSMTWYAVNGYAQTGPGYGYGGGNCPWCGQSTGPYGGYYGMGPGMMGPGYGHGYGMGPGMMGPGYGHGYGMGPGMMGPGYGYGMGPGMMGPGYGYGMGPGMMGPGYGYGMGPGMMGPGYGSGMGPGYGYGSGPQYGRQYGQPEKPLDKDQAKQQVEDYLKSSRNPNLKIGEIKEKGSDYEVNIVTKEGSLVSKVLVNKDTGWMRPAY
jgi:hypothetical protein